MGYADGYYYGQGRIICDTSTFSVGDTIRVRSMTDSSKVWNQQVVTVGTALVFTVPCYDYYKICTVQTINDTPTEIGGVYKTVDYGQTLFINVLDKTTLGGIQGILNSHEELDVLNIGDEVNISVGGNSWTMLIGGINIYNSHEVILVSKYLLPNSVSVTAGNYADQSIRTKCQDFYDAIDNVDKVYIKKKQITYSIYQQSTQTVEDYCFVPTATEVGIGSDSVYTSSGEKSTNSIIPIFYTQNARVKKTAIDEIAQSYVTATHDARQNQPSVRVDNTGAFALTSGGTYTSYVLPCFRIMVDS